MITAEKLRELKTIAEAAKPTNKWKQLRVTTPQNGTAYEMYNEKFKTPEQEKEKIKAHNLAFSPEMALELLYEIEKLKGELDYSYKVSTKDLARFKWIDRHSKKTLFKIDKKSIVKIKSNSKIYKGKTLRQAIDLGMENEKFRFTVF